jgi:hypothetical protein
MMAFDSNNSCSSCGSLKLCCASLINTQLLPQEVAPARNLHA